MDEDAIPVFARFVKPPGDHTRFPAVNMSRVLWIQRETGTNVALLLFGYSTTEYLTWKFSSKEERDLWYDVICEGGDPGILDFSSGEPEH